MEDSQKNPFAGTTKSRNGPLGGAELIPYQKMTISWKGHQNGPSTCTENQLGQYQEVLTMLETANEAKQIASTNQQEIVMIKLRLGYKQC